MTMAAGFAACRAGTVIDSDPRGADVVVRGVHGVTPFTVNLDLTTFDHYQFEMTKEGYETYRGEIAREANLPTIFFSIMFPPGFLWTTCRPAAYTFVKLTPVQPFPQSLVHEEPWRSDLPPLPPGMTQPARNRPPADSKPAER